MFLKPTDTFHPTKIGFSRTEAYKERYARKIDGWTFWFQLNEDDMTWDLRRNHYTIGFRLNLTMSEFFKLYNAEFAPHEYWKHLTEHIKPYEREIKVNAILE